MLIFVWLLQRVSLNMLERNVGLMLVLFLRHGILRAWIFRGQRFGSSATCVHVFNAAHACHFVLSLKICL